MATGNARTQDGRLSGKDSEVLSPVSTEINNCKWVYCLNIKPVTQVNSTWPSFYGQAQRVWAMVLITTREETETLQKVLWL